jgi:hypothetical protein
MRWADETSEEPSGEDEVELKTYTNNMIKESIRVRFGLSVGFAVHGGANNFGIDGASGLGRLLSNFGRTL